MTSYSVCIPSFNLSGTEVPSNIYIWSKQAFEKYNQKYTTPNKYQLSSFNVQVFNANLTSSVNSQGITTLYTRSSNTNPSYFYTENSTGGVVNSLSQSVYECNDDYLVFQPQFNYYTSQGVQETYNKSLNVDAIFEITYWNNSTSKTISVNVSESDITTKPNSNNWNQITGYCYSLPISTLQKNNPYGSSLTSYSVTIKFPNILGCENIKCSYLWGNQAFSAFNLQVPITQSNNVITNTDVEKIVQALNSIKTKTINIPGLQNILSNNLIYGSIIYTLGNKQQTNEYNPYMNGPNTLKSYDVSLVNAGIAFYFLKLLNNYTYEQLGNIIYNSNAVGPFSNIITVAGVQMPLYQFVSNFSIKFPYILTKQDILNGEIPNISISYKGISLANNSYTLMGFGSSSTDNVSSTQQTTNTFLINWFEQAFDNYLHSNDNNDTVSINTTCTLDNALSPKNINNVLTLS